MIQGAVIGRSGRGARPPLRRSCEAPPNAKFISDLRIPTATYVLLPAVFRRLPVAAFSKQVCEQYEAAEPRSLMARGAGTQVPQASQRTSLSPASTDARCDGWRGSFMLRISRTTPRKPRRH